MKTKKLEKINIQPISREESGMLKGGFALASVNSFSLMDDKVKNTGHCTNNCSCTVRKDIGEL
ncbi:hypothetical protein [uncultured Alistipes sp.]|uniref:hypothetical protein n=1 Tax=uncultured Alistipes sp. TaxID=538949 RepID=UPI0025E78EC6|nr:hypothetical protein [uncultured Alistipes sp.]